MHHQLQETHQGVQRGGEEEPPQVRHAGSQQDQDHERCKGGIIQLRKRLPSQEKPQAAPGRRVLSLQEEVVRQLGAGGLFQV